VCEITYHYFDNPEQESIAKELVDELASLFPIWVRRLYVHSVRKDNQSITASVRLHSDYLFATLELPASFFELQPNDRRHAILHETVHMYHEPILVWVRDKVIYPIKDRNKELHEYLDEEFTERIERFTTDMELLLTKLTSNAQDSQKP
jgi:hypothetical protein